MTEAGRAGSAERLLARVVRFRFVILLAVAVGNALGDAAARLDRVSDFFLFDRAGVALVSGRWSEVFAEPYLQVGPLTLAFSGLLTTIARVTGLSKAALFAVLVYVGLTFGIVWLLRFLYRRAGRTLPPALELAAGLLAIIAGLPMVAVVSGHPSEGIIPLLWVLAARDARDDRPLRSGAWIGVAAAFKPWGILALPLVLLAPGMKRRALAAGMAVAGSAAFYLPFVASGWAGTLSYEWSVTRWSVVSLFLDTGSAFPWWMRFVQGLVTVAAGAFAVVKLRSKSSVVWAAPLALVVARLATDPLIFGYYWLAAEVLAVVAVGYSFASMRTPVKVWAIAAVLAGAYALFLPAEVSTAVRFAVFGAFLYLGATVPEAAPDADTGASLYPSAEPV